MVGEYKERETESASDSENVTAAAADIVIILHFSMHVQVDWAHSIASANIKQYSFLIQIQMVYFFLNRVPAKNPPTPRSLTSLVTSLPMSFPTPTNF